MRAGVSLAKGHRMKASIPASPPSPARRPDCRVRRTHRRLRDALIELILEQGYDTITIQAIADRADVSRATFYLHYKDKDELLANSLEEMFDELVASLEGPLFSGDPQRQPPPTPPAVLAFRHVAEYSSLYKALLLGDRGVAYVIYREIDYVARIAQQQIEMLYPTSAPPPVPVEIAAQHVAGSLFGLILWWLEHGMPYSAEAMAQHFEQMINPAILSALGLPARG